MDSNISVRKQWVADWDIVNVGHVIIKHTSIKRDGFGVFGVIPKKTALLYFKPQSVLQLLAFEMSSYLTIQVLWQTEIIFYGK